MSVMMPVIRLEIEGLRKQVCHALVGINDEVNKHVIDSIEKQMTQDWVIAEIDRSVKSCLQKAIEDLSNNYAMRSIMTDVIVKALAEKFNRQD